MTLRLLVFASILLAGRALAGPVGAEFQANTYTTYDQGRGAVAVAADPAGNFVVVWDSKYADQDGDGDGVFGQRYDGSGTRSGTEFQVNTSTAGDQGFGALGVAADGAGNFVVVWNSDDGSDTGVFGQRFDSSGTRLGGEFQVNTYTTSAQASYSGDLAVAADPAGNFLVVWTSYGQDGDRDGVFARRFDSTGAPQGSDFQVNAYTPGAQGFRGGVGVAADAAGNFVVVWSSEGQDGSDEGVFGQRLDGAGSAVGGEFQVNTYTTYGQGYRNVAVAADPAGNFVVAWDSVLQDGDGTGVFARRYDSGGNAVSGEFQVNTYTTGRQGYGGYRDASYGGISVSAAPAGNFVVVWDSDYDAHQDGDRFSVRARRYDSAGNAEGDEFQVNVFTTGDQTVVASAADGSGRFVIAWASYGYPKAQDGSYTGVFGRRLSNLVRGRVLLVKNPTGAEENRAVVVLGQDITADIGPSINGDPTSSGATLRIITHGATDSDQTYVLDSAGWTRTPIGFRYKGPTGADGDPVKRLIFTRGRSGRVRLKATLKGSVGTQNLDVVPPNPGDDGGAILAINGGGTYCISFGGAAGGQETRDTAQIWRVVNAPSQPGCPEP